MENQNQIVELTQAETEQVEGGFLVVLYGVALAGSWCAGYAVGTLAMKLAR